MKNFLLVFILAFSLMIVSGCSLRGKSGERLATEGVGGEQNEEGEKIKEENREAIESAGNEKARKVPVLSESDHLKGDINVSVKMIVYSDFQDPYCSNFSKTLKQIESEFGDKVVIAFRHFPLPFHARAKEAAIVSECASEQGKFWEMHDKLFADNVAGRLNAEQFKKDAAELDLDADKFNQCLDSQTFFDKITKQMEEGKRAGILGTPTSFINDEIIPGAYPMDDFTDSAGVKREGLRSIINKNF